MTTSWVKTSSDYEGVREWLGVVLKAQATGDDQEIPPDFAAWISHLGWLNACLEAGTLLPGQLLRDEAEGLRLMDEVARELSQKLMRCPSCGQYQESTLTCRRCGKRMQGSDPSTPARGAGLRSG